MQSCAASAMDGDSSMERMASSSAKSAGASGREPETTSIFCSCVACPARTAARRSALMGNSGRRLQICLGESDGTRLTGPAGKSYRQPIQIEQHGGGFARRNLNGIQRGKLFQVAEIQVPAECRLA